MQLGPDTAIVRNDEVLGEAVGGETVLLELGADRYFRLNGTGASLWQELARPVTPRALASILASEHGVDEQRALAEVAAFLRALAERNLIHPVSL